MYEYMYIYMHAYIRIRMIRCVIVRFLEIGKGHQIYNCEDHVSHVHATDNCVKLMLGVLMLGDGCDIVDTGCGSRQRVLLHVNLIPCQPSDRFWVNKMVHTCGKRDRLRYRIDVDSKENILI